MFRYVIGRLLSAIPVVLLVSVAAFSLLHVSGEDPAVMMLGEGADPEVIAIVRHDLGLDLPLHEQYWNWLSKAARGDLGRSILPARFEVKSAIIQRAPVTMQLGLMALGLAVVVGVPLGVLAGVKHGTKLDSLASNFAILGIAIPSFVLAFLLILVFALWLRWVPPSGYVPPERDLVQNLRLMTLPAVTMAMFLVAFIVRITRASVIEMMQADFIRTARAKGLRERSVITRHALKPALIPVVTLVGLEVSVVLGGSIIIETIFALPGLGKLTIDAIYSRDFPILQGALLVLSLGFVLVNLIVDLAYAYIDPRIRYG